MARPQAFDTEQVLNNAMQLFWQKGYASTSVKDLTEVTELQPGSLYGAFENKRKLFLKSLDYYFEHVFADIRHILASDEPPLKRIRQFFDFVLEQGLDDQGEKSCLMVNTLLETPPEDTEIKQHVSQMFMQVETQLNHVLVQAQRQNLLVAGADPEVLAKLLMTGLFGLQVYNRMRPSKDKLKQVINNLLMVLEKPDTKHSMLNTEH